MNHCHRIASIVFSVWVFVVVLASKHLSPSLPLPPLSLSPSLPLVLFLPCTPSYGSPQPPSSEWKRDGEGGRLWGARTWVHSHTGQQDTSLAASSHTRHPHHDCQRPSLLSPSLLLSASFSLSLFLSFSLLSLTSMVQLRLSLYVLRQVLH